MRSFSDKAIDASLGVIAAVASSFLSSLLLAYSFRFPIPLGGYIGPLGELTTYSMNVLEVLSSLLVAWAFYGMLVGFILVPVCAVMGVLIGRKYANRDGKNKMIIVGGAIAGAVPALILSTLDYLIGPW